MRIARLALFGLMVIGLSLAAPSASAIGVLQNNGKTAIVGCWGDIFEDIPIEAPDCPNREFWLREVTKNSKMDPQLRQIVETVYELWAGGVLFIGPGTGNTYGHGVVCMHLVVGYQTDDRDIKVDSEKQCTPPIRLD